MGVRVTSDSASLNVVDTEFSCNAFLEYPTSTRSRWDYYTEPKSHTVPATLAGRLLSTYQIPPQRSKYYS